MGVQNRGPRGNPTLSLLQSTCGHVHKLSNLSLATDVAKSVPSLSSRFAEECWNFVGFVQVHVFNFVRDSQ